MTQKEYAQTCEIEKMKNQNKELKNKNIDLEIEKTTLKNQLKNSLEYIEDLEKENKTKKYNTVVRKNNLLNDKIKTLEKEILLKESIIQNLLITSKNDNLTSI